MDGFKPRAISSLETVSDISDNDMLVIQGKMGTRRISVLTLEKKLLEWLGTNADGDLADLSGLAGRVTDLEGHTNTGIVIADGMVCCEYEEG